jgi:signal peptidase I
MSTMWTVVGVACLMCALGLAALRRTWMWIVVRGNSMAPTIKDGDRLLVRRKAAARCRNGELVVFRPPARAIAAPDGDPELRVKRVVARPGDAIPPDLAHVLAAGPGGRVPPGALAVRGDNPVSQDSRHFGYVWFGDVVGVVLPGRVPPPEHA